MVQKLEFVSWTGINIAACNQETRQTGLHQRGRVSLKVSWSLTVEEQDAANVRTAANVESGYLVPVVN
jgi:hypothetical protein